VLVVGISVAVAMVALVYTARTSLASQIADNAEARAQDIALLAGAGSIPNPIPGRGEDLLVQVIDSTGTVVAASASIEGQAALVDVRVAPGVVKTFQVDSLRETASGGNSAGEGGADPGVAFLIASVGVLSPQNGAETVIVAASLNPVQQLVDLLVPRLAAGLPLIMLIVGFTVWALTGHALRPVEAIRSEAAAISAASLGRRVPETGTFDEIGRLAETMNQMLDRLEASNLAQQRFISDASHELKSPVASIRTMLDVARRGQPDDFVSFLDDLTAEDMRLEHLVRDLLVLARFDENPTPPSVVEVDLDDVVFAEVAAIRLHAPAIDISGVHPARLLAAHGNMDSLVRNLIENAARHASSMVWVAINVHGDVATLTVSDDGPGIIPENRERVFERFVRLDESRGRVDGGTGLGLSVCRAVARSMGGSIRVAESQHGGATFEVTLPIARPS